MPSETTHRHRCLRCDQEFDCQTPDKCKAHYDVMPTIILPDPERVTRVVEHCHKGPDGVWRPDPASAPVPAAPAPEAEAETSEQRKDHALAWAYDRIKELEAERATLRAERDEARNAVCGGNVEECPDCDGCGWVEGSGAALQHGCATCGGSGVVEVRTGMETTSDRPATKPGNARRGDSQESSPVSSATTPVTAPERPLSQRLLPAEVGHKTTPVQVWADVDVGIAGMVLYLNAIPGVRTHASCQGTLGGGGAEPYRPYVLASWPAEQAERIAAEFEVDALGEHHGYLHPRVGVAYSAPAPEATGETDRTIATVQNYLLDGDGRMTSPCHAHAPQHPTRAAGAAPNENGE